MKKIGHRNISVLKAEVKDKKKELDSFFNFLRKKKPRNLDHHFHRLHQEAFTRFNCLDCANCCSNISPIITERDIDNLARHFRKKPAGIIDEYLHLDEEGDYVFNEAPCPFLVADNYCMVYENRPKACRQYPHTNRRKMIQIIALTKKNCEICPVVFDIVEELRLNKDEYFT